MKILIVEDEIEIQKLMKLNLELEGYEVECVSDGLEAQKVLQQNQFQLLVLDIMLPNVDGLEITKWIREYDEKTKILMVSAKDEVNDRITGLKIGADDYLNKPFHLEEFILRVKNLLKTYSINMKQEALNEYKFGLNTIHFDNFTATTFSGNTFSLTQKEIELLKLLIHNKNKVVSRNEILSKVWGYEIFPSTRTIDNFIVNFRKYFEDENSATTYFKTVRGVGYMFSDYNP